MQRRRENRDLQRQMEEQLRQSGLRWDKYLSRRGHTIYNIYDRTGRRYVVGASASTDWHGASNSLADLRRVLRLLGAGNRAV